MKSAPASVSGFTVTTTATQLLGPEARRFLLIQNVSATATVGLSFGATTAALNAGGTFMLVPNATLAWPQGGSGFVPSDAINAIASASAAVTIETEVI